MLVEAAEDPRRRGEALQPPGRKPPGRDWLTRLTRPKGPPPQQGEPGLGLRRMADRDVPHRKNRGDFSRRLTLILRRASVTRYGETALSRLLIMAVEVYTRVKQH